ncbi:glutathione S-transferase theta-1-like [Acanthaster planci]|uniref:Glutathione S-transferase theta-1-like n=1 Tax=Acanthaster planci TaxID=133434 RepID=A0A8B7Y0G0_ACAPL|nr:glutathione S-transferase theta-1-like [Acanthaster planci]XP_022085785.1 glutathione S-transferase theta-1-like [Acanthaster planci]XP_022085786.1 glutathione S-transferase theta-1-like [Acanthaster planci]XP_022085787.1 glutathione S-transferase theta-1-like [Acanthaster planci]XP_022085788.1 glutathione S-transferase theta-1-like [Acanthaster planci]
MVLTVCGHRMSQPARSVYLFCKVAKIPYVEKNIDLVHDEQRQEAYLAINPLGQVPSIVDDDFKLAESMAILRYLARKYKVADHWYPDDLKVEAKVNRYLDWHHTGLQTAARGVFHDVVVTPRRTGKPVDEAKLAKDLETFDKTLGIIEKVFLGDKKYVASDEISIADICCLSGLMQVLAVTRTDVLAKYPNLAAWKERVEEQLRPDYDEVFKDLFKHGARQLKK